MGWLGCAGRAPGGRATPPAPPAPRTRPTHPPHPHPTDPRSAFLQFEGVDSCFYAWLNGAPVGFSKDSRLTAEFEVTGALAEGRNTLAVQVGVWGWSRGGWGEGWSRRGAPN